MGERPAERPLAAHLEPPVTIGTGKPVRDIGQQERILLRLEPSDRERIELSRVRPAEGILEGDDVLLLDQRDDNRQQPASAPVAARELGPDHNSGCATSHRQAEALE